LLPANHHEQPADNGKRCGIDGRVHLMAAGCATPRRESVQAIADPAVDGVSVPGSRTACSQS
jgi:hypothetical protein